MNPKTQRSLFKYNFFLGGRHYLVELVLKCCKYPKICYQPNFATTLVFCLKRKVNNKEGIFLPYWQAVPCQLGGQTHRQPSTRSMQVPPFWQGADAHSSTSARVTEQSQTQLRLGQHRSHSLRDQASAVKLASAPQPLR